MLLTYDKDNAAYQIAKVDQVNPLVVNLYDDNKNPIVTIKKEEDGYSIYTFTSDLTNDDNTIKSLAGMFSETEKLLQNGIMHVNNVIFQDNKGSTLSPIFYDAIRYKIRVTPRERTPWHDYNV